VGDTYRWMIYDDESFSSVKSRGSASATWLKSTTMASADATAGSPTPRRRCVPRGVSTAMIGGTEAERMRRKISKRNPRYHSEAVEKVLWITK